MQASFSIGQYQFITLRLDDAAVNGYGAAVAPRLLLQPYLDISFPTMGPGRKIELLRLSARLEFGEQLFVDALPAVLSVGVSTSHPVLPNYVVTLEFPMSAAIVGALERLRKGGNLKASFSATLEFQDLRLAGGSFPNETWVIAARHIQFATAHAEFPSSAWVTRVLPSLGYGVVHVIELPAVPLQKNAKFADAFQALEQARDRHAAGLYDDAAAKCRIALEQFFETVEVPDEKERLRKVPRLKKSWETRLGKATYEWLNSDMCAVRFGANPTHHSPHNHFDQLESQLLLAVTVALVTYVARESPVG
jgi:hypothetical protein